MDGDGRTLSWAAKLGLVVFALAGVFGIVLVVETSGPAPPRAGDELRPAPSPLLPDDIRTYEIRKEPGLADALARDYASRSVPIAGVAAATIPVGRATASVFVASFTQRADPRSAEFRAGVLTGAAAGFGIDLANSPVQPRVQDGVVVYRAQAGEGRLYVWFFRDAFVQLFIPSALSSDADEIQRLLLAAQVAAIPSPSGSADRIPG